jgi:hypothetical protein
LFGFVRNSAEVDLRAGFVQFYCQVNLEKYNRLALHRQGDNLYLRTQTMSVTQVYCRLTIGERSETAGKHSVQAGLHATEEDQVVDVRAAGTAAQ